MCVCVCACGCALVCVRVYFRLVFPFVFRLSSSWLRSSPVLWEEFWPRLGRLRALTAGGVFGGGRRGPGWDRAWKREEVWLFSCPDFLQQVETSQQGFSADGVPGCSGNLWMPRFFHRGPSAFHAAVRFRVTVRSAYPQNSSG